MKTYVPAILKIYPAERLAAYPGDGRRNLLSRESAGQQKDRGRFSGVVPTTQQARRQGNQCMQQFEHAIDGDADDAKR